MGLGNFTIERLVKKYSKQRISKDAIEEIKKILEKKIFKTTKKLEIIANNSKRKTIKDNDFKIL